METSLYRGLPPLGGLCSMEDAMKEGLSVEECVRRLKRYHYAFKRLHQIFTLHITAEPIYELKMAYSHHAYLCSEHLTSIRARVAEMREPPLGLEQVPDQNLETFFDEILAADGSALLLNGIYAKAIPALQHALEQHIAITNPLADAPSVRICRFALLELADIAAFGRQVIAKMETKSNASPEAAPVDAALPKTPAAESGWANGEPEAWLAYLDDLLHAAGGLDGGNTPIDSPLPRRYSAQPYTYDPVPRRDERFQDPYNMGVNAEAFLYDARYPARAKTLMLYYKRLREIDVPEMMASILAEIKDKPWEYSRDLSRQLWDEARHAMMGEVGFHSLNLDWQMLARINFTWSLALNTLLQPWERHAVLYFIEQGLMARTGKRYEWEIAQQSGNRLAMLFQDYDWADEVLHAHIGQAWYVSSMPSRKEALEFGDACWSKVFINWKAWRDKGLTHHENWWSALYRAACERWGEPPDPLVLAFEESYGSKRADLKVISA